MMRTSPQRRPAPAASPAAILAAILIAGAAAVLTASGLLAAVKVKDLPQRYQDFLAEVAILISKEERESFLEIEKDYQRDAFIERFWRIRDPYPETARNEFKERWDARASSVRSEIGDFEDDRARVLLLNGYPDGLVRYRCADLWPGEVWYYQRAESLGHEVVLLFFQPHGLGRFRLWQPFDGLEDLVRFPSPFADGIQLVDQVQRTCRLEEADAILTAYRFALSQGGMGFPSMAARLTTAPESPSKEWVATFHAYSTDLPEGATTFAAEVEIDYPGRYKTRTVAQVLIGVPRDQASVSTLGGHESYNFLLTGEVLREDKLFDSFRYAFNLPVAEVVADSIPMVFERYLRPGDYVLVLKLEDMNGDGSYFRDRRELAVPRVETAHRRPPEDSEAARLLAEANAAIASGETTIKIVPPRGELQTGMLRIDTLISGQEIAEVAFALDGRKVLTKRSPPFSVELDLGSLPRMRTLAAIAYDAEGSELGRDEQALNAGAHRFAVRLVEPRRGKKYKASVRAQAEVEVPEDQVVERVEFYLNERLVATLFQEPFVQPLILPGAEQLAYVRAVAFQPDGNSTEDLVFVNAPEYLEEVDVQFVELYVTVLDREKRPVLGLGRESFEILEDGVLQTPLRFDLVENLPIHAGIMLDVSASMEESLETARTAALAFFERAITPRDRATLITFNDHPNLRSKFTNDTQVLAAGLAGLKAERGTALYDSLVFALYYFNGIKGQRALIVLSDGRDEHSRFTYDDTLEYARRAGVAIYTVGLGLTRKSGDAKKKLTRLAAETGGRSFFIEGVGGLPQIYDTIQRELRSRYYIAYQSTNVSGEEGFRTIEVELARPGLEAKTLRGYYP